jgi:hypothetical protein
VRKTNDQYRQVNNIATKQIMKTNETGVPQTINFAEKDYPRLSDLTAPRFVDRNPFIPECPLEYNRLIIAFVRFLWTPLE